jgi:hypothetical protein
MSFHYYYYYYCYIKACPEAQRKIEHIVFKILLFFQILQRYLIDLQCSSEIPTISAPTFTYMYKLQRPFCL